MPPHPVVQYPTLQAMHGPDERLRGEVQQRPDIVVVAAAPAVVLGKNATTGIADSEIRRKLVQLRVLPQTTMLQVHVLPEPSTTAPSGTVLVNYMPIVVDASNDGSGHTTTTTLKDGDVLSLTTAERSYSYRVVLPTTNSPSKKRRTATTRSAGSTTTSQRASEEISCPICLEIYVQATLLSPCGHMACAACIPEQHCMTCRSAYAHATPCHAMDALIRALVDDTVIPNAEGNVDQYRKRVAAHNG